MLDPIRKGIRSVAHNAILLPERWELGTVFNPYSPQFLREPYSVYAKLRARRPAHWSRLLRMLVFTRHADVDAILRDHRNFTSDPHKFNLPAKVAARLPEPEDMIPAMRDPPDHTRLRALMDKAFARRHIAPLESIVRARLRAMLDAIRDPARGFDLVEAVAKPLPVASMAELLGIPRQDLHRFVDWAERRSRLLEPGIPSEQRVMGGAAGKELDEYLAPIIDARRASPRDDMISELASAEEDGDRLARREVLAALRLLITAGIVTTADLLGTGMLTLLRNPDQLRRLGDDPGLLPGAVEEMARFEPPLFTAIRCAVRDCEVNGIPVKRHQRVFASIGAANRDPEAFSDPDRFDVGRREGRSLAFGRGVHGCIGAHLARLQNRIVFEMLLERFGSMRILTDRPAWYEGFAFRGLKSLPVSARPA